MHICSALKRELHEAGERYRLNVAGEGGKEENSQQLFKMDCKRLKKTQHPCIKKKRHQTHYEKVVVA